MNIEQANVERERDWYFTFGSGQEHDGKYVVIRGTHASARDEMVRHFGRRWCDQYMNASQAGVTMFNLVELPRGEWPRPEMVALLAAVEQVIAAGHLSWDSGVDVEAEQCKAHSALVEAYRAVTR